MLSKTMFCYCQTIHFEHENSRRFVFCFLASVPWTQGHLARFGELLAAPPVIEGFDLAHEILKD